MRWSLSGLLPGYLMKALTQPSASSSLFWTASRLHDSRIVLPSTLGKEIRLFQKKKNVIDSQEEIILCLTQVWTLAWESWIKFFTAAAAAAIDDIDQNRGYCHSAWAHQSALWSGSLSSWRIAECSFSTGMKAILSFFFLCKPDSDT